MKIELTRAELEILLDWGSYIGEMEEDEQDLLERLQELEGTSDEG